MISPAPTPTAPVHFRNIHFAPAAPAPAPAAETPAAPAFTGRRRWVTRSPDEEYAARAGEVEPLAPELCALILFRKQKVTCTRDGLEVTIETDRAEREVKRKYWHENSLCCQPSWLGKEVFAVYNRHAPNCVYVFDADGALIEAIPEKSLAEFFAPSAQLAIHRRHQEHALQRLADLHAPDTREAVRRAAENAAQMVKVVTTLPAPEGDTPVEKTELVHRDSLARDAFSPLATHRAALARGIEQHEEAIGGRMQERAVERAATEAIDPAALIAARTARAQAAEPERVDWA